MAGKLAGKVAIITGAGSGQGAAMTSLFVQEGAKVVSGGYQPCRDEGGDFRSRRRLVSHGLL